MASEWLFLTGTSYSPHVPKYIGESLIAYIIYLFIYLHNTAGPVKGPSRRDVFTKLVIRTTEDQEHEKREE